MTIPHFAHIYTDQNGNTTTATYDNIDRLTQLTYQDQSTTSLTYECCGLNTVTDKNGTLTFTKDGINRVTGFTDENGKSISYGYDKTRNVTSVTYPDGRQSITNTMPTTA